MPEGRIAITGNIEQSDGTVKFSFLWKENGGPPVSKPTRKGFGSVILIDAAAQFGQTATANYGPEGFSYELQVLTHDIEISKTSAMSQPALRIEKLLPNST